MIIGITGRSRVGKDTAADVLVDDYGFRKIAFADKVRDLLYEVNPVVCDYVGIQSLHQLIDGKGWEGVKWGYPEITELLVRLGTGARNVLYEGVWIHAALGDVLPGQRIVVPDVRFPNEYQHIRKMGGGLIMRVFSEARGATRGADEHLPVAEYPSDIDLHNEDSLTQYQRAVHVEAVGMSL